MPRFYFDVLQGRTFEVDHEGTDCAGVEEAQKEAESVAAEFWHNKPPQDGAWNVAVEVRDQHNRRALSVTLAMTIWKVDPRSTPSKP